MNLRALKRLQRLQRVHTIRVPFATWTPWAGGSCPLATETGVLALLRDGTVRRGRAGEWCWQHDAAPDGWEPDDIVAFRLASAPVVGAA